MFCFAQRIDQALQTIGHPFILDVFIFFLKRFLQRVSAFVFRATVIRLLIEA